MKVLNSSKAFREHYVKRVVSAFRVATAVGTGGTVAGGVVSVSATVASTAAVNASAWSAVAGLPLIGHLPLIGGLAAGKAAAAGAAAATAAATSAAVLVPAGLILCAGVLCAVCWGKKKKSLHGGSRIDDLADAFARVAWLPMLASAIAVCQANPTSADDVRNYVLRVMGSWGYAESYAWARFDEALRSSSTALESQYQSAMRQLETGSTEMVGATSAELPPAVVRAFAEKFRKDFDFCNG